MTETLPVSCQSERREESLPLRCMLLTSQKNRSRMDRQNSFCRFLNRHGRGVRKKCGINLLYSIE